MAACRTTKRKPCSMRGNKAVNVLNRFLWQIVTSVAALGWGMLLIAAFSDRISPLITVYPAYFGLFFPFILAFNLLFIPAWLVCKKWKQLVLTLVVLSLSWNAIHTYFSFHRKTDPLPEGCIKVLTYNVMRFEHMRKHTPDAPNPILQYVVEEDPDIVCFQEFGVVKQAKRGLVIADVLAALKRLPYYHIESGSFSHANYHFGLALFSKYPILSVRPLPIESEYNGSFVAEIDVRGKRVTLVNNHLESNKISDDERSDYYNLTREPNTRKLESFTHMMFQRLTPAYKLRAEQAGLIAEAIRESRNPYVVVCGDFNDTPISYARQKIKGDLLDAFVESGSGMGISFNRYRFLFRIDYIFHSQNIRSYN
ncbi:MAG: endonuclease/exonuclease/phosphatase family protein, partial [Dysgonamonadaceae bacterium]|nr:endonuclease/exonuclease/phosphatase family protein [Dysgonamonadaceae bacterium]